MVIPDVARLSAGSRTSRLSAKTMHTAFKRWHQERRHKSSQQQFSNCTLLVKSFSPAPLGELPHSSQGA